MSITISVKMVMMEQEKLWCGGKKEEAQKQLLLTIHMSVCVCVYNIKYFFNVVTPSLGYLTLRLLDRGSL